VSCRYRPECHRRITALHPLISMYQLAFRWPLAIFGAAIATAIVLLALGGLAGRTHDLASIAQRESECAHEAREYSRLPHVVPGKIIATLGHYNERRHQCVVQISCEKDEKGGRSFYDEVVDPKTDHFIASRSRTVGERGMHDNTVITGAPVPIDDETGAQAWFNELIK
jgi:hypothetical protein